MESRKGHHSGKGKLTPSSELPNDFLAVVREILTGNFGDELKELAKHKAEPEFHSAGTLFADEIVLAVSIVHRGHLAATTVYASVDFDPKASSPTAEDLLGACVDALGGLFESLLDLKKPEKIEQLADESLSALTDVPFDWTPVEIEKFKVYLKIDKSNPHLDRLADDWLSKNDPDLQALEAETEKQSEALFVTGPKKKEPFH